MNKPTDFFSDDLSDILGGDAPVAPKALPQDEQLARIRDAGIGLAPTAKVFTIDCPKCRGRGRFVSYTGRDVGPCYTCKGKGKLERKTAPAQLERQKERRQELKQAVREEFKPQIDWLRSKLQQHNLPETYSRMLGEFLTRLETGLPLSGDETSGQLGMIAKGMARDAEYAAGRAARAAERIQSAPQVDVTRIVEALQRGKASGLVWVRLRFNGITMEEAKKHPGVVYVKATRRSADGQNATYVGKIVDSRFVASRDCTPADQAAIVLICQDPLAAAQVYGNMTGECCVCGRELTNKESIEAGIGPICSGRMGWTPGGIRLQAGTDF